jgi:peptidoglycan/xylan/chitin deacetylase (PgdA/CDA1 family)
MADLVAAGARYGWTSDALARSYARLIDLFDRFEVPATWAFVAAFVHEPEEVRDCAYLLREPIPYRGADWGAAFKGSFARGDTEGWLCPRALDLVRSSGGHEIASHGFSHLPFDEVHTSEQAALWELELLEDFWQRRGLRPSTFVFPRNQPGHLTRVGERFRAYRPPHPLEVRRDARARLLRLVAEMDLSVAPIGNGKRGRPAELPPAFLLNHRSGGRRLIPSRVTVERVKRLLVRAVERGEAVHLYSHPHNFLTGRGQFELLERMLSMVAERVRAGELEVLTQAQYADRLAAAEEPCG